jgi:hypothetical protein
MSPGLKAALIGGGITVVLILGYVINLELSKKEDDLSYNEK